MPIMMSVDEVKYILSVGGISTVKDAQIFMKANYAGKYNPADVNKALKWLIFISEKPPVGGFFYFDL